MKPFPDLLSLKLCKVELQWNLSVYVYIAQNPFNAGILHADFEILEPLIPKFTMGLNHTMFHEGMCDIENYLSEQLVVLLCFRNFINLIFI